MLLGRLSHRLSHWIWLMPVLLALVVNLNVLQNGLGWDADSIVPNISVTRSWWNVFLPNTEEQSSREASSYFRPIVGLSYYLDHAVWGDNPFGFHFSVWIAHILNTALVFFLARGLVKGTRVRRSKSYKVEKSLDHPGLKPLDLSTFEPLNILPLIAASLFAVHPIHAEAVAWIAGRNDVFCTTFLLSSMILYLRFHRTGSYTIYAFSMLAFLFSVLTKEMAVGLFFMFLLFEYLSGTPHPAGLWRRLALRGIMPHVNLTRLQEQIDHRTQFKRPLQVHLPLLKKGGVVIGNPIPVF